MLPALSAVVWLTFPGWARAADLTWSSVDAGSNPASWDVLGLGAEEENPANVALNLPGSVSCPSTSQCTAFGVGGTGGNENGVVATFDPSPLTEGVRAVLDTGFATLFTGA